MSLYYHTASGADSSGLLSVVCDVISTGSGDALLVSCLRLPVHGPVTADTTTAVCRYLFGAPDGLQRALMESHVRKIGSIKGLFLVNHSSAHTGGLSGLSFALSDAGAESISVVGPRGTSDLFGSTRAFNNRKYPEFKCVDVEPSLSSPIEVFDDGVVRVTALGSNIPGTPHLENEVNASGECEHDSITKVTHCWSLACGFLSMAL